MNSSRTNIFIRPRRRIWVSIAGEVIASRPTPRDEEPSVTIPVHWKASVVETTTGDHVAEYPTLTGKIDVNAKMSDAEIESEIRRAYIEGCRFADNHPDVGTLKSTSNAGLWKIEITITEPAPPPAHH